MQEKQELVSKGRTEPAGQLGSDVDWVPALIVASTDRVFELVAKRVRTDVDRFNELNPRGSAASFVEVSESMFEVTRGSAKVGVELKSGKVTVVHVRINQSPAVFSPTVDDSGELVFRGSDNNYRLLWQVSRFILWPLLAAEL